MSTPRISEVDERISSMFALEPTHWINEMPQWAHSFRELIEGIQLNLSTLLQSGMSDLRNCIPERYNGEFDRDIMRLQNSSKDEVFVSFLGYAVYLCTNNLMEKFQINSILQWVIKDEHFSTLVTFLDNKTASTEAFSYQLFRAALAQCNIKAVKSLLATGISLKRFMYSCATEFYVAVQRDDISLVSLLLKHGMDANMPVEKKERGMWYFNLSTILEAANSVEMIQLLINSGAIVDLQAFHTLKGRPNPIATPLQVVSAAGRADLVEVLIEAGANADHPAFTSIYGERIHSFTALMAAVMGGHFKTSRLLLQNGANPNQYSNFSAEGALRFPKIPLSNSGDAGEWHTESCPLQVAAGKGDLELVRLLVDYGADVNVLNCWRHSSEYPQFWNSFLHNPSLHNPSGSPGLFLTPLVQAIENGHLDVVRFLLQAGADVNQNVLGTFGRKAINAARDKPECLQVLIESGAVEYSDFDELDLKLAVGRGDLELVHNLLALGFNANMSSLIPSDGTILHMAVAEQDVLLINALLDNGADVNGQNDPRILPKATPLQVAVILSDFDGARLLCEAGADVNATGVDEELSPLQLSLKRLSPEWRPNVEGLVQIVDLLLSYGAQINVTNQSYSSPLSLAIMAVKSIGSLHFVSKLLELGASVNDSGGSKTETALEAAVRCSDASDDFKVVRLLLDWKADVNHHTKVDENNSLQLAVSNAVRGRNANMELAMSNEEHEKQCIKLVELLLNRGADVNAAPPREFRRTALQAAVNGSQNLELIDLLLSKGANINAPPAGLFCRTVLQAATSEPRCSIKVIQKLLDGGADVNYPACPNGGVTALQGAAIGGHLTIAKLLIENGARVNAPASKENGRTALEGASENGRLDMVQLLLNAGADLHLPPEERYKSSIEYAEEQHHIAIANLLSSRRRDILEQMSG